MHCRSSLQVCVDVLVQVHVQVQVVFGTGLSGGLWGMR